MRNRILSLILIFSFMMLSVPMWVTADDTSAEEAADETISVTISPENHANVLLNTSATQHNDKDKISTAAQYAYVNNKILFRTMRAYTFVTEFRVPLKSALTAMTYDGKMYREGNKTGTVSVTYIPSEIKTDSAEAMPTLVSGTYQGSYTQTVDTGETDESGNVITETEAVVSETDAEYNNWYNYAYQFWTSSLPSIGSVNVDNEFSIDCTDTAMADLKASESDYITFGTTRNTNQYSRYYYAEMPGLTLTYTNEGILKAINATESETDIASLISELEIIGILSNTTSGYEGYSTLITKSKEYVNEKLYEVISGGGFADLDAFYAAYDTNTEYAAVNGMLVAINSVKSTDEMTDMINELGAAGSLAGTTAGYEVYTALNDGMKTYVSEMLYATVLDGGFADLTALCTAYDKAVYYVSEIPAEILPENYATIHITKEGYADHKKYAKKLSAYYNSLYYGITYAEFGSLISGFNVPMKNSVKDISIQYYVKSGGMQSGRTIPIFYDYNMFSVDALSGSYSGPVAATDTTEAVEATQVYKDVLAYTENYWPVSDSSYSYSSRPFASQVAHNILETTSGTKTYDVTDKVLNGFLESESDSITFATGRETDKYANGSFDTSSEEKLPKLVLIYDALSVLEEINAASEAEMVTLIDKLGKAGILENCKMGYAAYKDLNTAAKARVASVIYDCASNSGFATFQAFGEAYDEALKNPETVISKIIISDSEKQYTTAADAAGKTVTIKAPVTFAETSGIYTAVFAEYADGILVGVDTAEIAYDETEIEFTRTLSTDTTDAKIMIFDSLSGMKPICKAVTDRTRILDGKKVIFIGNSFVYRGLTVIGQDASTVFTQSERSNDTGYFYQLCKANGCDVSVTNWTFGAHGLYNIFGGNACSLSICGGINHEDYLADRYFDYVIFSPGSGASSEASFADDSEYIMKFFRDVNPDVKFVCLGNASAYGCNSTGISYTGITGHYRNLYEQGVMIADWGDVITGILDGRYTVPGANQTYTKSSFIVSDEYHENALAGYITSLMAYCAITGEPAVGQTYDFYNNTSLNKNFDMLSYITKWYTNGTSDTNFHNIFTSESDMNGIQQLVDKSLKEKPYLQED